jgi:hypothetical protein
VGPVRGRIKTLGMSELSAWHKFRRDNFVKTDHPYSPPECSLAGKHCWICLTDQFY